ncbi:MAG: RNA polymerase sigma factor [Bacillota bacterium]
MPCRRPSSGPGGPCPGLRQPGSFRNWLLKTTANLCRDQLRKQKAEVVWDERVLGLSSPGPEDVYQKRELESRTALAIRDLPPQYKVLLVLRHGEGLSYQEIADTLGLPMTVVKNRMYRARRMLQQALSSRLVMEREVVT